MLNIKPVFFNSIKLFIKGILIGCSDIIPGISGSSIALITGIYTDLIQSIRYIDHNLLLLIIKFKLKLALHHINGKVLIPVALGIPIGIFVMSHAISFLLANYSIAVYGILFGLVLGASLILGKQLPSINIREILLVFLGAATILIIQMMIPSDLGPSYLTFFFAGIIAGCFMILPGISGSLILVSMGIYPDIIVAITNMDIVTICFIGLGAMVSIITMARGLTSVFHKTPNTFMAIMIGLMLGSTPSLWPWKLNIYPSTPLNSTVYSTIDIVWGSLFIVIGVIIPLLSLIKHGFAKKT